MGKIFDIISSLIPEEQHADIKAKIDGEVNNLLNEKEVSLKKSLSEMYKVNFFEEDIDKAFTEKNFVRKDAFKIKDEELQKALVREQELSTKINEFETQLKDLNDKEISNQTSIELLKRGFNAERLEVIQPLLKGEGSVEERVERIQAGFPELFLKSTRQSTTTPPKGGKPLLTEAEKYFQEKIAKTK